ncbi:hypothetical protein KPH14_012226 [Odynerus spinipes]|uniref:Uncharacterized protein n=1 Tax=Odynerus spinipes TaxID=1348599 RepID=A0AAD9RM47_9HYME|nr:hypothetical protein KPH14_012226 [Odynerus spinipes]
MDKLASDLKALSSRVTGVETRVDTMGADLKDLARKHSELSSTVTSCLEKVDDTQKSYAEALRGTKAATSNFASRVAALSDKVARLEGDRRVTEDLRGILTKASASHVVVAAVNARCSPEVGFPARLGP